MFFLMIHSHPFPQRCHESDLGGGACGDFPGPAALASALPSPVAAAPLEGLPRTRGAVDARRRGAGEAQRGS